MTRKLALMTFAGLALASAASAQTLSTLNLTDGLFRYAEQGLTSTFNRTGTGGGTGANFGFIGTNTTAGNTNVVSDYLFQNWWWYRSAGDTREFALSNQTFGTALGANSAFLRYVEPIGGNATANGTLTFEFTYTLNQISATQASVTINWGITNNSNSSQSVNFFAYADSDVDSFGSNDGTYTATGVANYYRNNSTTSNSSRFFVMAADLRLNDRWQVGPFSSTNTNAPLANLSNTALNNLPNLDSLGTAGDNSGAFQYSDMIIPAGGSLGGRITKGYNILVPTPGAAALLGLGALAVGRRRRA